MKFEGIFLQILFPFFIIFGQKCGNCNETDIKDFPLTSQSTGSISSDDNWRQQHQLWKSVGSSLTVQADTKHTDEHYSVLGEELIQPTLRRRPGNGTGRKRKRRPQTYSTERIETENHQQKWRGQVHDEPTDENRFVNSPTTRNPIRQRNNNYQYSTSSTPIKLASKIREPLAALEKEQKLYEIRDKQRKDYLPSSPASDHDKSYRKPYSQSKKEGPENASGSVTLSSADRPGSAIDLKNILKNSGGLSLSEILQQKNLSLDDLLKGKYSALQAIQTTTTKTYDENYNSEVTSESTIKFTKPIRRIPAGFLPSTITTNNNNNNNNNKDRFTQNIEIKSTQQTNRQPNKKISTKNQNRNDLPSTLKPTTFIEFESELMSEKSPNIFEMATIATLRDNPPVRKNIVYPSRSKLKLFSTIGTLTSNRKEMEKLITTERSRTTTKRADETTTAIPAYRRRASFRPKIKLPNLQKPIKHDSSSSSSSSSSSESASKENHKDINNDNEFNTENIINKEQFISSYDSQEDLSDVTNKLQNFYPSAPTLNELSKTTTNKPIIESIEEKLKQTSPEENFVDNFDNESKTNNSESNEDGEDIATLEELFGDASFKSEPISMDQQHQVITPRIDRYRQNKNKNAQNIYQHKLDITETNPSMFMDLTSDQSIDDRTELLELMEDRRSGNRLFKVLAQRNMTLDELVEHRKRGSSQLHLSQIINNKKSRVFPSNSKLQDNLDIVTAFENFPHFNLIDLKSVKPDEIKTDSQGASYFTSIIDIEPTDEIYQDGKFLKGKPTMQAQQHQQSDEILLKKKPFSFFPSWKSLSLASYAASNENSFLEHHNSGHHISQPNDVDIIEPIIKIDDDVGKAHDLLDLELSGHGFKRNLNGGVESIHIPAGIQSAIIASSAIVTISLIIFLFIFIICRWRQKRKKKLSYVEHYNAMKSKLPAIISQQSSMNSQSHEDSNTSDNSSLNGNNCSQLSTIMLNGITNDNRLSTMDPNSPEVHDYLFDAMRKQF